jgi:hypothetical protein
MGVVVGQELESMAEFLGDLSNENRCSAILSDA